MTHYTFADLDMADRHLAEGEELIARQERLLTSMRLRQQPTEVAESLLISLNRAQAEHRAHRAAIAAALDGGRPF